MYDYVKGDVAELTPAAAVIDVAGVGYHLNISLQTYTSIGDSTAVKLFVHFIVREDAQIFYGFYSKWERDIFRLLISVSGVGGNTARMVLSTFAPAELVSIISTDNVAMLKSVKGLGVKTAQKIIVELKDKVIGMESSDSAAVATLPLGRDNIVHTEALSALIMLGFPRPVSEKALRSIVAENPELGVEDVIRMALKKL